MSRHEGWVRLGYMVDPSGKPFEITVLDSTGDKLFESAAVGALKLSTFEPGMLDGKPTDSGGELKYIFSMHGDGEVEGATREFVGTYHALIHAIDAKNQKLASDLLGQLSISTLYEDAHYGLALYKYAKLWGTVSMQLAGLKRATAIAGLGPTAARSGVTYITGSEFKAALIEMFAIEVRAHQYAEALDTWNRLQRLRIDPKVEDEIKAVVEQLSALRSDDRAYDISDVVPADGGWNLKLFKRHFRISVDAGYVSVVKLWCAKRYVYFVFDPKLEYTVNGQYGTCTMGLQGAPGTKFTLEQF